MLLYWFYVDDHIGIPRFLLWGNVQDQVHQDCGLWELAAGASFEVAEVSFKSISSMLGNAPSGELIGKIDLLSS